MSASGGALEALIRTAASLRDSGRYGDAAKAYANVVQLAPRLATVWFNLGYCQRMAGAYDAALTSYQTAIDCGVDGPEEAHLNRAVIMADALRREADAERELGRALRANPRYAPAMMNLANLAEDFGRREEAGQLYQRVLSIEPERWEALARYANIMPDSAELASMAQRLEHALARRDVNAADRASLGFALGRARDRLGEYDAAFAAYAAANAASRAAHGVRYDRDVAEREVQAVLDAFSSPEPMARDDGEAAPIFICGMFRSGSTLLEQVLAGHSRVTPGGEMAILPEIVREGVSPFPARARSLDAGAYSALAKRYRELARKLFPNADLVTDKWLGNTLHVGLIKRMFPNAKIVHTVRHPLDNVLSVYFLHLDPSFGYAFDMEDTAHQLLLTRRLMQHWRKLYPGDVIDCLYDDFVAAPEAQTKALLAQLGLDWQPACLAFEKRTNAVKTASVWQVRQPLYQSSSGRWRHYEAQLAEIRRRLDAA